MESSRVESRVVGWGGVEWSGDKGQGVFAGSACCRSFIARVERRNGEWMERAAAGESVESEWVHHNAHPNSVKGLFSIRDTAMTCVYSELKCTCACARWPRYDNTTKKYDLICISRGPIPALSIVICL